MEGSVTDENSGIVSSILELGEERMGEVVNQLLANEAFASALQNAVVGSLQAKRSVDKNVARLFGLVNVPTLEDFEQVNEKLAEVEELLGQIQGRVDTMSAKRAPKKKTKKKSKKKAAKKAAKKKTS
jgi:hypothetical protein